MSKTVFDHLSEQIDQVVRGRRFIIAEVGKLKVSVEDLKDAVGGQGTTDIAGTVNDLKVFIQQAVSSLGELKSSLGQLSASMGALNNTVENTYNVVKSRPATSAAAPRAAAPTYNAPAPTPTPTYTAPRAAAPTYNAPAPTPTPTYTAPRAAAPAPSAGGDVFANILNAAKSGKPSVELGGMIDSIRTGLSKKNPLNPILFELSMEAGRLKSLGTKTMDGSAVATFEQKIQKWKAKSG